MEWTKISTELLSSRKSDKEILAITKYQLLWAMLEREPDNETALRYMTSLQLSQARKYVSIISRQVNVDIISVENHRKRQKKYCKKKQTLANNTDGQSASQHDAQYDGQSAIVYNNNILNNNLNNINNLNNNILNIPTYSTSLNTDTKSLNENNLNTPLNNNLNISPCVRVREEFIQRAKMLADILSDFHKIHIPDEDVLLWAVEIAGLQKQNKIPLKRMDKVLGWLKKYIDEDYVPAISNGKDFKNKFISLEKQLERIDSKYDWKVEW